MWRMYKPVVPSECRGTRWKTYTNLQFWLSVCVGWYLCGKMWNIGSKMGDLNIKDLPGDLCPPCQENPCPPCDEAQEKIFRQARNSNVENSVFRKYPYKPQNFDEDVVSRWRVLTKKHNFEMINLEPRIGINGMWRLEQENVEKFVGKYLQTQNGGAQSFKCMLRRTDPFYGTTYHVKMEDKITKTSTLVQVQREFYGNKPKLIDVELVSERKTITVISPVQHVSERFTQFLNRFEKGVLHNSKDGTGGVKLLFVIFKTDERDNSAREVLQVLDSFKKRNPRALVEYVFKIGKFNRALGIHTGVEKCRDDDLMLFIDVDLNISKQFFDRIRRNTVQHKTVMFPVTFSQYDPDIIDKSAKLHAISIKRAGDKMAVNDATGFWIHYAFGITSMYKSDYVKVGGFKLDITGWGGEDVDLYKKFVEDPDIEVISAVDKDLIHVYHSRGCDPNLAHDQYVMCVGSWSETLGSQAEVASLYLAANISLLA